MLKKLAIGLVLALLMALPASAQEYKRGQVAYYRGDFTTALREWQPLAERGYARSQYSVGVLYDRGQGVSQDYGEAAKWYRKAAEQGYSSAQFNLAQMFRRGQGVRQDYAEAAKWFRKAAEQGNAEAKEALRLLAGQAPPTEVLERVSPGLVKKVQQVLEGLGYDPGPPDGTLGPRTRAAVRAFQADAGIAAEGRVSRRLLTRLERSVARTSPPRAPDKNHVRLVRAGRKLSLTDARILERKLAKNPDALWVRGKLLGFYFYKAKRALGAGPTIEARRRHVLWLIRNRPEGRLVGSSEATIDPIGHALADKEGYQEARALWLDQAKRKGDNKKVLLNAAKFLQLNDKELAAGLLTKAGDSAQLGIHYALGVLRVNMMNQNGLPTSVGETEADYAFAKKARAALEGSSDLAVVGMAGSFILRYGLIVRRLHTDAELMDFVGSLLKRSGSLLDGYYEFKGMLATSPVEKRNFARLRLGELEKMRRPPPGPKGYEVYRLKKLVKAAFAAGDMKKAGLYANKLLEAGMKPGYEKRRGTALHQGNLILGRIALKQGKKESAKAFLIKAGRMPGGATFGGFGPNMALAKELLEAGEQAVVIEYLQICKKFWPYDRKKGKLDRWIKTIRAGKIPKFGGNLVY